MRYTVVRVPGQASQKRVAAERGMGGALRPVSNS